MAQDNVAAIRAIYDAFAVGDVGGVLGGMSPDIVWNEADDFPYADGNPYVGPQAVAEGVFARCIGEWDGFSVEIDELLDAGDTVIALGHYGGTFKTTGRPQRTQMAHVWRLSGGKAVAFQQYANTLHVAKAMGKA
ncbi:nuclear transport factor 2 family protein [Novosphingobium sp.]|uniref:nuclear transport factor 2 family protein n=1 Tax=Novosphingobium sp. TaxID=1874826 RepID=UPI00286E8EF9|nr:nuclear transport factor 2 family protein [Novosphingobium sp.]